MTALSPVDFAVVCLLAVSGAFMARLASGSRGGVAVAGAGMPFAAALLLWAVAFSSVPRQMTDGPAPPIPAPSASGSPAPSAGPEVAACPAISTSATTWLVSDAPRGRSHLTITQPRCTTLIATSGSIHASAWSCGNLQEQQCAFVNRTGTRDMTVELDVDIDHVWYGITNSLRDEAVAAKQYEMLASPNCGGGCAFVTLGLHRDAVFERQDTRRAMTASLGGIARGSYVSPQKPTVEACPSIEQAAVAFHLSVLSLARVSTATDACAYEASTLYTQFGKQVVALCPNRWVCQMGTKTGGGVLVVGAGQQRMIGSGTFRFQPAYSADDAVQDGCRFLAKANDWEKDHGSSYRFESDGFSCFG